MIDDRAVEAAARAMTALHYAERFAKPLDDPHVLMNVAANWYLRMDDARAALTAAAPFLTQIPDGWKTIDTAPPCDLVKVKPTYALLYIPGIGVRSGEVGNYLGKLFGTVPSLHGNAVDDWGATHWMPLPLPPTEKNDD